VNDMIDVCPVMNCSTAKRFSSTLRILSGVVQSTGTERILLNETAVKAAVNLWRFNPVPLTDYIMRVYEKRSEMQDVFLQKDGLGLEIQAVKLKGA